VRLLGKYIIWYNGWGITVEATNEKQARHRAYVKFNETYPTQYGVFMQGIEEVSRVF
jgi:hypothetical protein